MDYSLFVVCTPEKRFLVCGPRYFNFAALETQKDNTIFVIVPSDGRTALASVE